LLDDQHGSRETNPFQPQAELFFDIQTDSLHRCSRPSPPELERDVKQASQLGLIDEQPESFEQRMLGKELRRFSHGYAFGVKAEA
jgi:hypothetical protein